MLHQMKGQQFYTIILVYINRIIVLQKIVKFKYFSRPYSDSQVLFKAYFIIKDFSRKPFIFKYFSSMYEPCGQILFSLNLNMVIALKGIAMIIILSVQRKYKYHVKISKIWKCTCTFAIVFLIHPFKHVLFVLKRAISLRRLF